jgi:hypothetical protein
MTLRASMLVGFSLLSATALAQTSGPVNAVIVSNPGPEAVIRPQPEPLNPVDSQRSLAYFAGAAGNRVQIRAADPFLCADFASGSGRTAAHLIDPNGDTSILDNVTTYGGWQNDTGGFRFVRDASASWQFRVDVSGNARCYSNFIAGSDLLLRDGFEQSGASADLAVEVVVPPAVVVGQAFQYIVRVRNLGDVEIDNVRTRDWYPKVAGASQPNDPAVEVAGPITCVAKPAGSASVCGNITQGGTLTSTGGVLAPRGVLEFTVPRRLAAGTPNTANFRIRAAVFAPMTLTEPFDNNRTLSAVIAAATDAAPAVTASTPVNGATVAANTPLNVSFSEPVNATAGAVTLSCTPPGGSAQSIALTGTAGQGVTLLSPTYAGELPFGASCTLTVQANLVTDVDALDPPDNMASNFVATFSVDAAPVVTGGTPANGASGVPLNSTITYVFSEPVTFAQTPVSALTGQTSPVSVVCGGNAIAGTLAGSGTNTVTFTPNQPLPGSSSCTVSGLASSFRDADSIDPPDQPASIPNRTFTTTDAPPAVVATTPANGGVVANNTALAITFSESVEALPSAVTLTCNGAPVTLNNVGGTYTGNPPVMNPTYAGTLANGASCTLRVIADRIFDLDGVDPATMTADVIVNFTVDAPPALVSFSPNDGASNVNPSAPVVLNFSERVNIAANAVMLECPVGTPRTLTGLPATNVDSVSLLAQGGLPAGTQCRVTINAAGITDVDAADPPDALSSSTFFSFGVANPN